ncbi:uba ts-n domain-containing protein [Stagonosporopsis vannaccii]|nr:uba ts-n domain-containing protein [Stagonosporopsis vannaccii]
MDDLNGLDWSQPAKQPTSTPAAFPPFRQSPTPQLSGRSTPLSGLSMQQSGGARQPKPFKAPSKPATPANDSFASLISSKTSKPAGSGLSLQERQKQLQEEKLRQEAERRKQYDASFGGADSQFWSNVGSEKSTPEPSALGAIPPPGSNNPFSKQTLSQTINKPFAGLDTASKRPMQSPPADDLLAAFNSAAPVDKSSHFPPPSNGSGRSTPALSAAASRGHTPLPQSSNVNAFADDDDDMFGLKQMAQKSASPAPPPAPAHSDDDDILGLLGKPVEDFKREEPKPVVEESQQQKSPKRSSSPMNAHDRAVAELVDMGFSPDQSAIALATTDSGLDVQAAVGWILNQAHAKAKQRSQEPSQERPRRKPDESQERPGRGNSRPSAREDRGGGSVPAWMRDEDARSRSGQRRQDGQRQEKDVTQVASEIGSNLFKSANSLWKQGRKQVQKAVADFQQDGGDPSVPKWMRDAQAAEAAPRSSKQQQRSAAEATDEAMMLEAGGRPGKPSRQNEQRQRQDELPVRQRREQEISRNGTPDRMSSQSPARRQPTPSYDKRPAARLTRQEVEEQSPQAYVSPARRKKATQQPQPEIDLFSPDPTPSAPKQHQPAQAQSNNPFLQATSMPKTRTPARTPSPPRPKAPPRRIPPVSSSALSTSARDRQKGSEAFKRGDYSAAHIAYTSALGPLPDTHPVTIIVLCNRAVTNIKVGDPKAAITDADAALAIIGVSKGEGEKIASSGPEGDKEMKEFYGKALMRKAEALEHMEKWTEAHKVWKMAVQDGVGGAVSISGRNRCEKAATGGNNDLAPAPVKRPPVRKPAPKPFAMSDLGGGAPDSEAVKRLKLANAAAEKADDEKFALSDQVDAKLIAWKGGKTDNLRALLGSLDSVLWPEAGWKKVGMGDLVMPNKVKINYMKAIAKVHPDKIPQSATTEQKMISASVFATLNEAWDKFKADNNL